MITAACFALTRRLARHPVHTAAQFDRAVGAVYTARAALQPAESRV